MGALLLLVAQPVLGLCSPLEEFQKVFDALSALVMTSAVNNFEVDGKSSGYEDLPAFGTRPLEEEVRASDVTARQTGCDGSEGTKLSLELNLAGMLSDTEAKLTEVKSEMSKGVLPPEEAEDRHPMPTASEEVRISLEPPYGEVGRNTGGPCVSGDVPEGTRVSSVPGYGQMELKTEEEKSSDTRSVGIRDVREGAVNFDDHHKVVGSVSGNAASDQVTSETRFSDLEIRMPGDAMAHYEEINPDSNFPHFASLEGTGSWMHDFEAGDMVWGKVKSHPWWPGQIFNEAFASPSVRRTKRDGHFLVAFFGDSSYGWFDPAELIPFDSHFAEKSRQTNSRTFMKAVEEAVDEASRRQGLGLSCYCRNQFNFRPTAVPGFFSVDVVGYEPGVYSRKQIEKARDGFNPIQVLSFVNRLAATPQNIEHWNIDWIKSTATVLALRKALFEEFDETYAEAFGVQPVRPTRDAQGLLDQPPKASVRAAPLSGPLVFAEALGDRKHSAKTVARAPKDPSKKNKYLFKRREELPSTGSKFIESAIPRQPVSTETKPAYGISAHPSPATAAKESLISPGTGHALQGQQGNIPYFNLAQGPGPDLRSLPQSRAPNVHYISQGNSSFIIPSLPIFKQSGDGTNLYTQFDEYVLQKRSPSNAEQQQPSSAKHEEGKISEIRVSPQAHASSKTSHFGLPGSGSQVDFRPGHSPAYDVGVSKTKGGVRFASTEFSKSSVKPETSGFVGGSAADSKDGSGVWYPHVLGSVKTQQDLSKAGDGGRVLTVTSGTNAVSSVDTEAWPGSFPQTAVVGVVKEKVRKRVREDGGSEGEKKKKKKKREPGSDGAMDQPPQKHPKVAKDGLPHRKSAGKSTEYVGFVPEADSHGQAADRVDKTWLPIDSAPIQLPKLDLSSLGVDFPQLVSDLTALALDPFYGMDRDAPVIVRYAFLKFRFLVYQKSLVFPSSSEPDSSESRVSKSLQEPGNSNARVAFKGEAGDTRDSSSIPKPPKHPLKPNLRRDDPTKGGRKRVPSDRLEEKSAKRMKKLTQLKTLASDKKAGLAQKAEDIQNRSEQKETGATAAPVKPVKSESVRKPEPPPAPKVASPTYLVMKFPTRTTLPTISSMKARFARFGPLDLGGTRVYWKTFTCKVLFKYRADAKAAYNFGQNNFLFGQIKVDYSLRDADLPASELPEPGKQYGKTGIDDGGLQFRPGNGGSAVTGILRHQQQSVQLKSCLKKLSGDDAGPDGASVVKESPRVKFMLGGDDGSGLPSTTVGSNNDDGNGVDGGNSNAPLEQGSKGLKIVGFNQAMPIIDLPAAPSLPSRASHMPEHPSGAQSGGRIIQGGKGGGVDISIQMLSLLLRCSDVVNNLASVLGYAPLHPL